MSAWVALTLAISFVAGDCGVCADCPQTPLAAAPASPTAARGAAPTTPTAERHYQQQGWWITETTNFRVCSLVNHEDSSRIARHCEALRTSIRQLWLPDATDLTWKPRCDVIAHWSDAGYIQAVGRGGAQTAGSALIEIAAGAVAVRRIDLRAASREALDSALAHEMTHVILADRFTDKLIPRWADEGMAVLADSRAKQKSHWQDLQNGLRTRSTLRVAELVGMEDYPAPQQMDVFYGQSVSIVSFLLAAGERGKFVEFVEAAVERGYDRALQDVYQIAGVRDLEQRWLRSLRGGDVEFKSSTPKDFPVIAAADIPTSRRGT